MVFKLFFKNNIHTATSKGRNYGNNCGVSEGVFLGDSHKCGEGHSSGKKYNHSIGACSGDWGGNITRYESTYNDGLYGYIQITL